MSLKVQLNPTRRRNDSGELDVFEATEYFSTCNEVVPYYNDVLLPEKAIPEERQALGGRRMSLDMKAISSSLPSHSHGADNFVKEEKQKVPSSPGGRVASFLRTLFYQTASKKKKSMSSSTQSMKGEEEIPDVEGRKRRSSMSLFHGIKSNESKSVCASSGFRTPPLFVDTPAMIYKDLRSSSDHKHLFSLPKYGGNYVKSVPSTEEVMDGKEDMDLAWLDKNFNFVDGFSVKAKSNVNKDRTWFVPEKNVKMPIEVDDGGESDSSSDLFELENHHLGAR